MAMIRRSWWQRPRPIRVESRSMSGLIAASGDLLLFVRPACEHPVCHWRSWRGILRADAYLMRCSMPIDCRRRRPAYYVGAMRAAISSNWTMSPHNSKTRVDAFRLTARDGGGVRRIDEIFALRQEHSALRVADPEENMRESRSRLSKNGDVAEVMDDMLKAWSSRSRDPAIACDSTLTCCLSMHALLHQSTRRPCRNGAGARQQRKSPISIPVDHR